MWGILHKIGKICNRVQKLHFQAILICFLNVLPLLVAVILLRNENYEFCFSRVCGGAAGRHGASLPLAVSPALLSAELHHATGAGGPGGGQETSNQKRAGKGTPSTLNYLAAFENVDEVVKLSCASCTQHKCLSFSFSLSLSLSLSL